MSRARPRARRSRYSVSHRLSRSVPALIGAVLLVAIVVTATVAYRRIDDFLSATTGKHLTLGAMVEAVQPEPGTMAYKLQHGQQVNILLLGMGGYENDAPFLTDSIMAVTIDPNSHRVMLASIPRNLVAYTYPNYGHGYIAIHYKAGCQHLSGEQALQVARSRHAIEPQQSSDFGRSRRQQDIMQAIKKKATTVNGWAKAPQLLDALQKNIHTDMSIADMKAIYDWGKNLPDSAIIRLALTAPSGAAAGNFLYSGNCGMGNASQLCPEDPSYRMIHQYIASAFVDQSLLAERAPVQFANGSYTFSDLADRVTTMLDPLGLQLGNPISHGNAAKTLILDYSGGQFPKTTAWLANYFGGQVIAATPASPQPARGQQTYGIVVVLGHDFGARWFT